MVMQGAAVSGAYGPQICVIRLGPRQDSGWYFRCRTLSRHRKSIKVTPSMYQALIRNVPMIDTTTMVWSMVACEKSSTF